jgi:Chaperone of endosialidase
VAIGAAINGAEKLPGSKTTSNEHKKEGGKMGSARQRSIGLARGLGFFLVTLLFGVVVGTAAAQNTAYGTGALSNNTTGTNLSAFGSDALFSNTTGNDNTASGFKALYHNTIGQYNTAIGIYALLGNTEGSYNTASGTGALGANSTGYSNTASGYGALNHNTTGNDNIAGGFYALYSNTTGDDNTANGFQAMFENTDGYENAADGTGALYKNTTGYDNTASGTQALFNNTFGYDNTASGSEALYNNNRGSHNTAIGSEALFNNTGFSNIGLGVNAGSNIRGGSNNIEIGNAGTGDDSNTIRIGTNGTQTATYIAGISGTPMTGGAAVNVVVSSTGQLGVRPSSARYKRNIQPLRELSSGLWQLRPVTFRYKQDPSGERQYGLIAEQVAKVYPELVVHGNRGEIETLQYDELIPLMLNEMQHQQAALTALKAQNAILQTRLQWLEQRKALGQVDRIATVALVERPARDR